MVFGMKNIALGLEYLGTNYSGWQKQPLVSSVQQQLEEAISKVAADLITVNCAGRTDAKVHAKLQVTNFTTTANRSEREWLLGINTNLPKDIKVLWVKEVDSEFHARYSALSREYTYVIYNQEISSPFLHDRATWVRKPLNIAAMQQACTAFIGEHDFSAFRSADCQAKTAVREIFTFNCIKQGNLILLQVKANAFLHHMVRNMVGVLIKIGQGERLNISELLEARDRTQVVGMAAAAGLYLCKIAYPEKYNLPEQEATLIYSC